MEHHSHLDATATGDRNIFLGILIYFSIDATATGGTHTGGYTHAHSHSRENLHIVKVNVLIFTMPHIILE